MLHHWRCPAEEKEFGNLTIILKENIRHAASLVMPSRRKKIWQLDHNLEGKN
jgi:hypothetical protein